MQLRFDGITLSSNTKQQMRSGIVSYMKMRGGSGIGRGGAATMMGAAREMAARNESMRAS